MSDRVPGGKGRGVCLSCRAATVSEPLQNRILADVAHAPWVLTLPAQGAGDEVLVVASDFPSDILPWLAVEERLEVKVRRIRPAGKVVEPEELLPR